MMNLWDMTRISISYKQKSSLLKISQQESLSDYQNK